jgi:hypothetical protein
MHTRLVIVLALLAAIAGSADARGKKPASVEPGKYKEWGPDIDEIEIVKTFKLADYDSIVVVPFDTSAAPLPDAKERSYTSVKTVLDGYTDTFVEALRDELKGKAKVERGEKAPKAARTLAIRGKVEDVSPGSRAKRYIGGFGAGAAGNKMSGEIVDARTGAVLARFSQERRSAGTWKFAGGNDVQVMRDSIHAVAQDVAHLLEAF